MRSHLRSRRCGGDVQVHGTDRGHVIELGGWEGEVCGNARGSVGVKVRCKVTVQTEARSWV